MIMVEIKSRHINDLIIYLQKTYKLYFVEFRETVGERQEIVICNHKNKDWWISIIVGYFKSSVFINVHNNYDKQKRIESDIRNGKHINSGKIYQHKWLRL